MIRRLYVNAIGFAAPGIESATALFAHFDGSELAGVEDWRPSSARLPRRQALRLSVATQLAIMVAEQIDEAVPEDAAWVFASSAGEGHTLHEILTALCQPEIMVQPLRFQNSVHNAAQGQWSIISKSTGPATSIAAYDNTVGAALLKAMMQAVLEDTTIGLVMFDAPLPPPLHAKRPIELPMAAALALSPEPTTRSQWAFDLEVSAGSARRIPEGTHSSSALFRCGNPIRHILPLLERMHQRSNEDVVLELPGGTSIRVAVSEVSHAE